MKKIGILKEATSNILQKMFFMIEQEEPVEYTERYSYYAKIDDSGFEFLLLFTNKISNVLAENFLGVDNKVSEKEKIDCLKEIINMIAGNFIGLCKIKKDNLISIPSSKKISQLKINEKTYQSELLFYDNQPLKILFKEK